MGTVPRLAWQPECDELGHPGDPSVVREGRVGSQGTRPKWKTLIAADLRGALEEHEVNISCQENMLREIKGDPTVSPAAFLKHDQQKWNL